MSNLWLYKSGKGDNHPQSRDYISETLIHKLLSVQKDIDKGDTLAGVLVKISLMLDFNPIFEFSRTNCAAICAFLVPINLVFTLQTLILAGINRPQNQVRFSALVGCLPAMAMVLHVCTWLMIGVVMAPTFILWGLGTTCLALNIWAIIHSISMTSLLRQLFTVASAWSKGTIPALLTPLQKS